MLPLMEMGAEFCALITALFLVLFALFIHIYTQLYFLYTVTQIVRFKCSEKDFLM